MKFLDKMTIRTNQLVIFPHQIQIIHALVAYKNQIKYVKRSNPTNKICSFHLIKRINCLAIKNSRKWVAIIQIRFKYKMKNYFKNPRIRIKQYLWIIKSILLAIIAKLLIQQRELKKYNSNHLIFLEEIFLLKSLN